MPQFGASLIDDSRIVIYDGNMFIVQATAFLTKNIFSFEQNNLS